MDEDLVTSLKFLGTFAPVYMCGENLKFKRPLGVFELGVWNMEPAVGGATGVLAIDDLSTPIGCLIIPTCHLLSLYLVESSMAESRNVS